MSEALVIIGPDHLPIPRGATAKQVKLAARMLSFDPESDTFTDVLQECGYARVTALASARRALESAGVRHATAALVKRRTDSASGFMALSAEALATASADLKQLGPGGRLEAGLKFAEFAHASGSNIERTGSAADWQDRVERIVRQSRRLMLAKVLSVANELGISAEGRQRLITLGMLTRDLTATNRRFAVGSVVIDVIPPSPLDASADTVALTPDSADHE